MDVQDSLTVAAVVSRRGCSWLLQSASNAASGAGAWGQLAGADQGLQLQGHSTAPGAAHHTAGLCLPLLPSMADSSHSCAALQLGWVLPCVASQAQSSHII